MMMMMVFIFRCMTHFCNLSLQVLLQTWRFEIKTNKKVNSIKQKGFNKTAFLTCVFRSGFFFLGKFNLNSNYVCMMNLNSKINCCGYCFVGGEALLCSLISKSVLHSYHFHRPVHQIKFSPDGKWVYLIVKYLLLKQTKFSFDSKWLYLNVKCHLLKQTMFSLNGQ